MKHGTKIFRLILVLIALLAVAFFLKSKKGEEIYSESENPSSKKTSYLPQSTRNPNPQKIRNSGNCGLRITQNTTLSEDFHCLDFTGENVIEIEGDSITLDCAGHDLTLLEGGKANAIGATGHNDITIKNCRISGGSIGIRMEKTKRIKLLDNQVETVGLAAIDLHDVENFTVKGNMAANHGKRLNAIEVFGSNAGYIENNRLSGFRLSGITINGSVNISISGNKISQMGDTGIGIFRHQDRVSNRIQINDNDITKCENVGGVEIMHGSQDVGILSNYFHENRNAIQIYSEPDEPISNLEIRKNKFDKNNSGVMVTRNAVEIQIRDNEFHNNNTAIALTKCERVRILENRFVVKPAKQETNPNVLELIDVNKLRFNRNIIEGHKNFIRIQNPGKVDFSLNYWNGCPSLDKIFAEPIPRTLSWINPVHTSPCKYMSRPLRLIDANNDGRDDNNCRSSEKNYCFDKN